MVPHVVKRGSSFKGASLYYLHDKQAKTNDRVAWTYTHNLPTMDAGKGFNYMASTAMQAEVLKRRSGVSKVGKKSNKKPVYSFSLSWHPEQEPEQSAMQKAALEVLAHLGLSDHEAVFVAHNDEPQPHVHVIANLVHPETGKTATVSYDYISTSNWAEDLEREGGKIYCEQRVINNRERRENANDNRQLKLVKHREKRLDDALVIQTIYSLYPSGKDIQTALENEGYTLAEGRKGRILLVNQDGEIHALARQLKGQRAKDIRERLQDIEALPEAQSLSDERKHFMRDDYETKSQIKLVDDAIEAERQKEKLNEEQQSTKSPSPKKQFKAKQISDKKEPIVKKQLYVSYAEQLDKIWEKEHEEDRRRLEKEKSIRAFYDRGDTLKQINELQNQFTNSILPWTRKRLSIEIKNKQKMLQNIDQRMNEQGVSPEQYSSQQNENPAIPKQKQTTIEPTPAFNQNVSVDKDRQRAIRKKLQREQNQGRKI